MRIILELLGAIAIGIIGAAQGIVAIVQFVDQRKNDRLKTEELLFDLQRELTTGETWEMLNRNPVDSKYLILTYERIIAKFVLLKKIANENSPAIYSIVRNLHYLETLISSEYKNQNNVNEWTKIYQYAQKNLKEKVEHINRKILIISDFYSKEYTEMADSQTVIGERLLKTLDFSGAKDVLDFGCGDGRHSISMLTRYPTLHVDAFDGSAELIRIANDKRKEIGFSNINFWIEDANSFYKKEAYDIVFSNFVIHWVGPQCFKIIYDALKFGGQFVASISGSVNGDGATPELREVVWRNITKLKYDKYFEKWNDTRYNPSRSMVEEKLKEVGFTEIEITTENYDYFQDEQNKWKTHEEIYTMQLITTLPPYYIQLGNEEERKRLFDSALSCLLEESPPLILIRLIIKARKI